MFPRALVDELELVLSLLGTSSSRQRMALVSLACGSDFVYIEFGGIE